MSENRIILLSGDGGNVDIAKEINRVIKKARGGQHRPFVAVMIEPGGVNARMFTNMDKPNQILDILNAAIVNVRAQAGLN